MEAVITRQQQQQQKKRVREDDEDERKKSKKNPFDLYEDYADVVFEFDEYIDEILPQVYEPASSEARKAAVEAAAASAPPGMSVQKLEQKYRTVVCRHWIRGLCMKGEQCEFLHQYDVERMPLCRRGPNCKVPDCPYRHVSEDDKPQCVFFQQGFCVHGLACRYRHLKLSSEKRPTIADFSLGIAQNRMMHNRGDTETYDNDASAKQNTLSSSGERGHQLGKKPNSSGNGPSSTAAANHANAVANNEFYKISLCRHFAAGMCPYGDECHFAHGQRELRPFRGRQQHSGHHPPPPPPPGIMNNNYQQQH